MLISPTEGYFENSWCCFLEEPMLSVGLKMKLLRKTFPVFLFCLKTCQKGQPSIFTIWWITFFTVLIMEFIELNWLYKHIKKIRSSQPAIPALNWVKYQSLPVSIVKRAAFHFAQKHSKYPAGNCMFKVNNRNTRTRCEICSGLTIQIP